MSDRASEIQTIFNNIAPVYDNLNDWLSLGQHRIWKLMTVKWSQAKTGDTCLDLCCGSGDLTQILAHQVGKTGQVFGVDFAAELLAIAKQRTQNHYPPLTITWVEADVLHLPFPDNHFDSATMGYGLRNVTDIPQCLRSLYRVLKPGATAAILDFHRPYNPLMQNLQQWYLKNIVVTTAQNFGLTEEYAYISPSLDKFPQGQQQVKLAQQAGFSTATHYQIAGGIMGVLRITK
jgi:demethylmenaquinone methyltransferase/2-methoxy-6-polyprenyl-1,4-benzoquinol methylase